MVQASRTIHAKLINSVLWSTFRFVVFVPLYWFQPWSIKIYRWLDETPTGRIIARCTQDIKAIDSSVPSYLLSVTSLAMSCLVNLGAIVLFTPIFIIPGFGVGVGGALLGNWYLRAQLSIKREMRLVVVFVLFLGLNSNSNISSSNARSPVLSHFSAVLHGLGKSTIPCLFCITSKLFAYKCLSEHTELNTLSDKSYSSVWTTTLASPEHLGIWIDGLEFAWNFSVLYSFHCLHSTKYMSRRQMRLTQDSP